MATLRSGDREQLYMLELLVNQLTLSPEISEEISGPLSVRFKFLDLDDEFPINQEEFSRGPQPKENTIDFASGKSCVFSTKPRDLIQNLQANPLIINICRSTSDPCPQEPQRSFCKVQLNLSGCFCEIERAMRDPSHLPEPYSVRDTYNLTDDNEKSSGNIDIFLRLSCLGESLVTHFHVNEKAFLFKNTKSLDKFSCIKLPPSDEEATNKFWTPKSRAVDLAKNPEPKTIIGISAVCEDLVQTSPRPISLEVPARIPEESLNCPEPPKIEEKELTVDSVIAENTNYEFTTYLSPRKFPCGGRSCPGGICSGLSSSNQQIPWKRRWQNEDRPREIRNRRLRGGNDDRSATVPIQSMQTLLSGVCRSFLPEDEPRLGCGCHTKLGNQSKIKKKCYGIDCLIKSFKEAEQFVESIGRVPGMAGLGLMDPMESPFFGRPRHKPPPRPDDSKRRIKSFLALPAMKKDSSILRPPRKLPSRTLERSKSNAGGFKKSQREDYERNTGEELMTIKEPQMGPCGQPVCKSRRKINKSQLNGSSKETLKTIKMKKASLSSTKQKNRKLNLRRAKNLKNYERNYSHVKVGKRVMRLVEGVSQRSCFGHRSCVEIRARVPGNMGWLWNTNNTPGDMRPQVGWKPGAISRRVWSILEQAKMGKDSESVDDRPVTPVKGRKGKMSKSRSLLSVARSQRKKRENENERELPPTLHVHRKNGDYYITMYPVKPEGANNPEALESIKPLQFKVTKDRDGDDAGEASSIGDDMEFEFSPPGAIHKYQKTAERQDLETQVVQQEILEAFKPPGGHPAKKKKKGGKK